MADEFTLDERAALAPYFTTLDGPVFALVNLPEVVKGALFARYSRSPKSLRRLFLDEFLTPEQREKAAGHRDDVELGDAGTKRAEQLYERVFFEYGDDSVAQLGGVHLACEGASNILTKVLEWGRLMAYLEQSTRYIPYDDQPGGRYRYHVPKELPEPLRQRYVVTLVELRKVIPGFLRRVDLAERGGVWSSYLAETREAVREMAERFAGATASEPRDEVTLVDFDPDGEVKVVAAALYAASRLPDDQLLAIARRLTHEERLQILSAYVGKRANRRHRPGRAFERTAYRFDVLTDYGAFRDLQRHRLLTLEWQRLTPRHGYVVPVAVEDAGGREDWGGVVEDSARLHDAIADAELPEAASYAVAMAYRVRFYMDMNAREAMHVIELRTAPQGHPAYRRVCQTMHRLIAERAGHRAIAAAMTFADHSEVALERLESERAAERRRRS